MVYVYIVISAVILPIIDRFNGILHTENSWWQCPLLFLAFLFGFILLQFAVTVISVALVNLKKPADRFSGYYRWIVSQTLPIFFKLARVKIHTEGIEKLPENSRFLFVCNHIDNFDPIVILSTIPQAELGFIAKKDIYTTMPLVAKGLHKLHGLPIDRENDREAAKTIIKSVNLIKDDKASVAVFPEGYTSKNGELLPMRNGAFKIAYRANVPIAVAVIQGTPKILKNMFLRRTDVYFKISAVISPEDFKPLSTAELGDKITEIMRLDIEKIKADCEK